MKSLMRTTYCGLVDDTMMGQAVTLCGWVQCGAATFRKQVTAAGFQLKGSGWYATDFRNGQTTAEGKKADDKPEPTSSDAQTNETPVAKPAEKSAEIAATKDTAGGKPAASAPPPTSSTSTEP